MGGDKPVSYTHLMEQGVEMSAPEKIAFQQGSTMLELADDINVQGGRAVSYTHLKSSFRGE